MKCELVLVQSFGAPQHRQFWRCGGGANKVEEIACNAPNREEEERWRAARDKKVLNQIKSDENEKSIQGLRHLS